MQSPNSPVDLVVEQADRELSTAEGTMSIPLHPSQLCLLCSALLRYIQVQKDAGEIPLAHNAVRFVSIAITCFNAIGFTATAISLREGLKHIGLDALDVELKRIMEVDLD